MNLSIPVSGMQTAEASLDSAAASITKSFQGGTSSTVAFTAGDTADLSTAVVGLLSSKQDFLANLKVAQVEDDLTEKSISLLA